METAENSILARLKNSGRLPTPKGVALEVINLTQREDASNHDIVRLVSADPALSARVIRAANVLLGNSSRPVVTIADAVTVLGARALRQLVLGIALIADYRHGPCKQFDYQHFWTHSLLTGIAARHLAAHARLAAAEEIFVLGLLGNIGQLALATVYPKEYGALLAHTKGKTLEELHRQEHDKFGCDHAELSEEMLADMHFPKIFQTIVRDFRQPETGKIAEGSREWQLLHLLHLASLIADACLSTQAERGKLVEKIRLQAALVAIEAGDLITIGEACARDWLDWLMLMNMGAVHIPSFAELLDQPDAVETAIEIPQWPYANQDNYKMRVLVVEHDRSMLVLLQSMLAAAGHNVLTARDGVEAMRLAEQHHPQLVISDCLTPQMDGVTLCRKLRESYDHRNMYVIILTAQQGVDRLVESFEAGADDCMVKPLAQKIFFARLRTAQRVVRLQEELAFDRDQMLRFSKELAASNERLQRLALTDALTELPNRRFAMERIEQEWALSKRGDRTLSCMMVDIDHFKSINDRFGHQTGDDALKAVALALRQSARTQDVVCRYGGEEFLIICPDADIDAAYQGAERLRLNVAALIFKFQGSDLKLTISIGVAEKKEDTASIDDLLSHADDCLYSAKESGRNKTVAKK
ncbi:MAG: diguanylate cyclase [Nitrosomonadales bacterium]|nr:diguanylate cyclase [Nitrosomonadales bacterium]